MSDLDLFRKLTTLHLTQEEKRFMQQNVLLHARERGILSPLTSLFVFSRSFVSVTAMALVLLLGTTVVHGAERSIPGDPLYVMKRGVNERVLGVFAVSDDAKARLETKFVDRRLEEIQKIIVQEDTQDIADSASIGEEVQELSISPETLAIVVTLTEEVQHHAKMAEEHIEKVSDSGSADDALVLASKLESSIDVHTSTLATLTDDGGEDETLVAIAETVQILSDSSDSVAELGDTIAVTLVEDTSIVDREKAEAQLAEAEKLLALYVQENPVIVVDVNPTEELAPSEIETSAEGIAETVQDGLFDAVVATTTMMEPETTITLEEDVSLVAEEIVLEAEPVVVTDSVVAEDLSPVTGYILPTLEEVQAQIAACRSFIDIADYANAYITCTDALQSISTLTQVQEKTSVVEMSVENEVVPSETSDVSVVHIDEQKDQVEEKNEVSIQDELDTTTLTGKGLDAFDQGR